MYENRVLRTIFGPTRGDVTGGWINPTSTVRTVHQTLRRSNQGRRDAYKVSVSKSDAKRPPPRPRRRNNNIKIDLKSTEYKGTVSLHMAQDRELFRAFV